MKKIQIIFLFVFLTGCLSNQSISPTIAPDIVQTPSPFPTQTAIPPTQTLTPTSTFTPTITPTAIGGGAGKIAFTSDRDGVTDIYVMNSDGSNLIRLANSITPKGEPAWSPDGSKIAFGFSNEDSASLYHMNADGSNLTKLIDTKEISIYDQATLDWRFAIGCCNLAWSPDGKKIAFSINHYVGCCWFQGNIYVMNVDGSNLISIKGYTWENEIPAWSPDSQMIVVSGSCGGFICVMNADGTNPFNITHQKNVIEGWPNWSPDGTKIAFGSNRNGNNEIYIMNTDGTNSINLTRYGSGWDNYPIWSPDGAKIVFSSYRDGNYEIYVMNADGTNPINLTNNPAGDGGPVWSPDSQKIAFSSDRDGNSEIYVIDVDGNNLLRLTNNDAADYSPTWSP